MLLFIYQPYYKKSSEDAVVSTNSNIKERKGNKTTWIIMPIIVIYLFVRYRLCIDQVQLCFKFQSLFVLALVVSLTICIINTDVMAKQHTTRGPRGPWNAHPRQTILKSTFFHRFMYNKRHLGGLNLKAKALKCTSTSKGQV